MLPSAATTKSKDYIDFAWPSELELKEMIGQKKIYMKKLDIWTNRQNYVKGVRIELTNGVISPIFKTYHQDLSPRTELLVFDRPVKKIRTQASMATYLIEFYDKDSEEICRFNQDDSNFYERVEQEIPEDRGIIGVYGFLY